jgi:hypothetical protein
MSAPEREKVIATFYADPKAKVILISLKAGGTHIYPPLHRPSPPGCVERFSQPACVVSCGVSRVCRLCGKSGLGLNVTCASHVYLLDPWWNPSAEEQAIDRVHRIGQKRPVHVKKFVIQVPPLPPPPLLTSVTSAMRGGLT